MIIVGVLATLVSAGGFFAFLFFSGEADTRESKSIEEYARMMVEKCAGAPYRPTCYETEVPKLVSDLPTERIFDVVRQIRRDDPEYLFCHVLAHELGNYEVSLDPDKWLDVVAKGPTDGLCSNGYAHGALVARFNDEDLSEEEFQYALKDLAIACEKREGWNPTELTKAICYHGVGHVLIHMTLADVPKSLEGCEAIGLKEDGRDYRKLCTEGVYMQLFQPLEPEDFALVDMLPEGAPTHESLLTFCTENSANDQQFGACWREAWPLIGQDIYTGKGIIEHCSVLSESQDKPLCFVSAFTINGRHNLGNPDRMAATCNELPSEYMGTCFARVANAFPEEDPGLVSQAVTMCGRATEEAAQEECYGFLAQVASFNFHPNSPAFEELCTTLPPQWENTCRNAQ